MNSSYIFQALQICYDNYSTCQCRVPTNKVWKSELYNIKILKVKCKSEELRIWWKLLDEREEMEKRESNAILAESP